MSHAFHPCKRILAYTVAATLAFPAPVYAASTDLADGPLAEAAASVKPNMLLILDDSGSMARQFTPDYVSSNSNAGTVANCFDTLDGGSIGSTPEDCYAGDPPAMSPDFNTQYYNPSIRYFPAVNYDGTSKGEMNAAATSNWRLVPTDNVSATGRNLARKNMHTGNMNSTTAEGTHWDTDAPGTAVLTIDLTSEFPDRVWCDSTGADATNTARCKTNGAYTYPEFTFGYGVDDFGNRKYKLGAPYYYRITPTEYCTDRTMTVCTAATAPTSIAGVDYNVPAPVRFCDSTALTNCQAKRTSTFKFPKFLGTVNPAAAASAGTKARGKIIIEDGDTGAPTIQQIRITRPDNTTVDLIGVPFTTSSTDNSTNRNTAAGQIRDAINLNFGAHGYVASVGNVVGTTIEVLIDAPVVGVAHNTSAITVTATPTTPTTPARVTFTIANASNNDYVNGLSVGPAGSQVNLITTTLTCNSASSCPGVFPGRNSWFADAIVTTVNAGTGSHGYTAERSGVDVTLIAPSGTGSERNDYPVVLSENGLNNVNTTLQNGITPGDLAHSTQSFTSGADATAGATAARENVGTFVRTNIVPANTYPKFPSRNDCLGATACTYAEEITNFANWYAYYRTRMQMAKTSIGRAFLTLGSDFRVGFMTINFSTSHYLAVDDFTTGAGGHKESWFTELYDANASGGTALRGALARAGRYYADKDPGGNMGASPIQLACQPSYAILTSDGYWNDSSGYVQLNGTSSVGNQDSGGGTPPAESAPYSTKAAGTWDGNAASNTLADVAMYYYKTDLRTDLANQVPASGKDFASHQHMTTFTVGMGLAGTLTYDPNYETQTSGDFFDIRQGSKLWPVPTSSAETTLDDLWHAAVNGRGRFFSAQDPVALANGISETLNSVQARIGAGAAAATSNLQPVAGDNFAYTAQYQTVEWSGDLKARTIDLSSGVVSTRELWSAQNQLDARSAAHTNRRIVAFDGTDIDTTSPAVYTVPKTVTGITQSLGTATATATAHGFSSGDLVTISGAAPADYNQTATITVVDANTFTYSVPALTVTPATTGGAAGLSRTQNGNRLRSFCPPGVSTTTYPTCNDGGLLTSTEMTTHFDPLGGANSALYQSVTWPSDGSNRHITATGETLVNFLRGDTSNETTGGTAPTDLFRNRAHRLGDIVNAQPAYVKVPPFAYSDANYATFKANNANRLGMVYSAANDGMLHAFRTDPDNSPYFQTAGIATALTSDDAFIGTLNTDPVTGEGSESWGYIPSMVFPTLKRLAETNYATNHRYSVDGSPVVADVCFGHTTASPCATAADWRTILVAGLNKGGRGFYALDITDPENPKGLWELKGGAGTACIALDSDVNGTQSEDCNIGFSYGNPIVAKRPSDGKWVAFVTSGHNNISPGDGKGHLYMVDVQTGKILKRYSTTSGDSTTPSGLSRINGWVDNASSDNTVRTVYGGDLNGNVWRFQLETVTNDGSTTADDVAADSVSLLATVKDPANAAQPITTRPELAEILNKRVIYVGTGQFLGMSDKSNQQRQSIYAIKDEMNLQRLTPAIVDMTRDTATPTGITGFKRQTLTTAVSGDTRTVDVPTTVDFSVDNGWFIDLPDGGTGTDASERLSVDPILQLGTLVLATNVPSGEDCVAGGFGWVNFLDYRSGSYVVGATGSQVSTKIAASLVVGINVIQLPGGTIKTIVTTADNQQITQDTPVAPSNVAGRRVTWRELSFE